MVRFINEIILKYLLGISKCTKLPGKKKEKQKQNKTKQYLGTNTSLHIRHIYILEISLATFFSKILFCHYYYYYRHHYYFISEKKKFPLSALKRTRVGFLTSPALRNGTRWICFQGDEKTICQVKFLHRLIRMELLSFLFQRFIIIQSIYRTKQIAVVVSKFRLNKTSKTGRNLTKFKIVYRRVILTWGTEVYLSFYYCWFRVGSISVCVEMLGIEQIKEAVSSVSWQRSVVRTCKHEIHWVQALTGEYFSNINKHKCNKITLTVK